MPVVEVVRALGSWDLNLSERTPQHVVDLLQGGRFGHIAVDAARDNPEVLGDELLSSARFVGVLRGSSYESSRLALKGSGMSFWLGAEDSLGDVFETALAFAGQTFSATITGLLPPGGAVTAGTITTPTGASPYVGTHRYQTPRQAIDYVCDLFSCDWRVNGDATLDAGLPEDLYVTDPQAAVIRRAEGVDMGLRALPGSARLDSDVEDFTTRVVTLAEGEGSSIAVGEADISVNPYVDMHGNPITLTRLVSESNTSATNADARAALALQQYTTPREQVSLSTTTHDIRGDLQPGDSVWVYDPDAGLVDWDNEIVFRGDRISPVKLRVFQVSWPVEQGMGVYFRTPAGVWVDLTDYVEFEEGQTNLTVGGYDRSLTQQGESVGFRPNLTNPDADSSVPGVPAFVTPFTQNISTYPNGLPRAELRVEWSGPTLNTDGTAFVDGAHREIRYRIAGTTSSTWAQAAAAGTWADLQTWGNPVPLPAGDWAIAFAPIDTSAYLLQDLTPGTEYELQIRAVDSANPPNAGAWSASHFEQIGVDNIAPLPPAAPIVAASLVQVSVRHNLGLATGGTFNLPGDLAYLEVHVGGLETFTPDATTRVGKIIATRAQIVGEIPVIGTFPAATPDEVWVKVIAVDQAGNHSDPSAAAAVTVELIDSQWVSDLTADKITAGDFTASYGLVGLFIAGNPTAARFAAGDDGTRTGFMLHRPSGTLAVHGDAATGNLSLYGTNGTTATLVFTASTGLIDMRGKLTAGASFTSGDRIVIDPDYIQPGGAEFPTITLYSAAGAFGPARINATTQAGNTTALGLNSGPTDDDATYEQSTLFLWPQSVYLTINASGGGVAESDRRGGGVILTDTSAEIQCAPSGTAVSRGVFNTTDVELSFGTRQLSLNSTDAALVYDSNDYISVLNNRFEIITNNIESAFFDSAGAVVWGNFYADLYHGQGGTAAELKTDGGSNVHWWFTGGEYWLTTSGGVGVKTFVIDHPDDPDRWLAHACIEGPTADLIYRGEAVLRGGRAVVKMPGYFESAARPEGRQAQATPVGEPAAIATSDIENGQFEIRCNAPDGTRVKWLATAIRADVDQFDVEPRRDSVDVVGFGPYRSIVPKSGGSDWRPRRPAKTAAASPRVPPRKSRPPVLTTEQRKQSALDEA